MALPTKLTLHIVSPDTSISQEVDYVSMPGFAGDFGVLPGTHAVLHDARNRGMWYQKGSEKHFLMVAMGFAKCCRIGDGAGPGGRARGGSRRGTRGSGMKRAEEMMGVVPHEIDFERARREMLTTLQRMQAEMRRGM